MAKGYEDSPGTVSSGVISDDYSAFEGLRRAEEGGRKGAGLTKDQWIGNRSSAGHVVPYMCGISSSLQLTGAGHNVPSPFHGSQNRLNQQIFAFIPAVKNCEVKKL